MRSAPIGIPFDGDVPAAAVAAVLQQLLGEHPGRGWVRLVVDRDEPGRGVGTELKKLLAAMRIVPRPGCKCLERAAQMDRAGIAWCDTHISTIVGWLREEAESRGLPFVYAAARLLVRRAIRNARRLADGKA